MLTENKVKLYCDESWIVTLFLDHMFRVSRKKKFSIWNVDMMNSFILHTP